MPFEYVVPPTSGALKQGEILSDVWEHRVAYPPVELAQGVEVSVKSLLHPRVIVMTAECDLLWDYQARTDVSGQEQPADTELTHPVKLPHVLLCELYKETEIRFRVGGSDIWKRIRQNQDERYHHFVAALIGNPELGSLPDLYLDFKKTLSLPTDRLYEGLERSSIGRVAVVPPIYLQDLMHRFYSFLGRVGVPE